MADPGDHAYTLALGVLGDVSAATDIALHAVRRGGRSRVVALAYARHLAVERAGAGTGTAAPARGDDDSPASVVDLAVALAATRPPAERAIADLAGRHGLDRTRLGRTLGLAPAEASERSLAVADAWARELDPALVAWLGPGDCAELAIVLAAGPAVSDAAAGRSVRDLLDVAPSVASHIAGCELCTDRTRSMVTVHSLVTHRPLDEAPAEVRAASRRNRFRPPAPLPPPLDRRRRAGWARPLVLAAVIALLVAATVAGVLATRRPSARQRRVAVLTRVPEAGSRLTVSPAVIRVSGGVALLRNVSPDRTLHWRAGSTAGWLAIAPADGALAPGGVVELTADVLPTAPEGDLQTAVTVTGDDGSVAAVVVETTVEHPPTLEARIEACTVTATAEDESAVASVVLHWRDGRRAEHAASMAAAPSGPDYLASLPARDQPLSWWVTAVDSRGNRTQSPDQPAPAC